MSPDLPDYSNYSQSELREARRTIDAVQYPVRLAAIEAEIESRPPLALTTAPDRRNTTVVIGVLSWVTLVVVMSLVGALILDGSPLILVESATPGSDWFFSTWIHASLAFVGGVGLILMWRGSKLGPVVLLIFWAAAVFRVQLGEWGWWPSTLALNLDFGFSGSRFTFRILVAPGFMALMAAEVVRRVYELGHALRLKDSLPRSLASREL